IEPLKGEQVVIEYALREAGLVSIKVYNLQGGLAAVLQDQYYAAGSYSCQWGGQTVSGALAASGVYVINIKTPSETKTQKVVVIK
ncbi:T9SS type A sorting domain-containing protein, partial [candidate division FCPU426 bacterium]|nr:T9SS type A sorting domain-containing protein [candidate division FCPU426 bacterium]